MDRGKIGLPQGNLTDEQIAKKVAKEFIEALIARDYQKAGQIFGIQGELFELRFEQEQTKFLRIFQIGTPKAVNDPRSPVKVIRVPMKVQVEKKGKTTVEDMPTNVRPVGENSDRWSIRGDS